MNRAVRVGWMILGLTLTHSGSAQSLGQIQWQQSFGGIDADALLSLREIPGGGYVIAGASNSGTNGNKTSPNLGGFDYWLIRVDANGEKLWERCFGGSNRDWAYTVTPTSDAGFLVGGESYSETDGSKTSPNYGGSDYWAVRLDSNGNKLWDASFGGSGNDVLSSVQQTSDNGFILGGWSFSGADGNKADTNFGGSDIWLVRLDSSGNKVWERSYGGSANETDLTIQNTSDGGFVFCATSRSGASGNKTNTASGVWVVRLDFNGNKLWERIMVSYWPNPTATTIQPLSNGEFFVASSVSYDGCLGVPCAWSDFYLARLDAAGNQVWFRPVGPVSTGGPTPPILAGARQTADGGFVAGYRLGNLTASGYPYHIYRLNNQGNYIWIQDFGAESFFTSLYSVEVTRDGGFILGGYSGQSPSGNKTSPSFGSADYWVVKLFPEQARLALLPTTNANERLRFQLQTSYFGSYEIDRSVDLSDWRPWQTNLFSGVTPEIVDYDTNAASTQFYRAKRLP